MNRFQRSVALAKASWNVLRGDGSLMWFPVLAGVVSAVLVGVMALIGWATAGSETTTSGSTHLTANAATFIVGIVGYFGVVFVQTYFLGGLVASASQCLDGRATTVGEGLRAANARSGRLFAWALLTGTVTWILQAIEERAGIIGRIVMGFLGAAWTVLTFLTVPIVMFEDVGPINALKRSGTLFKQTWGENLIAQVGIGLLMLPVVLVGFAVGALAVMTNVLAVQIAGVAVAVVLVLAGSVIVNALSGIYRTALYRYAVDGAVPQAFAGVDMEHAFGPRKGNRAF
jgi:hypothetical protein